MNTNDFFLEISRPVEGENSGLLIEKLFKLARSINNMSPEDLIALFQALSMLKKTQPSHWFKRNPVQESIIDTQIIVITAMQKHSSHSAQFNNVIGDEWVRGHQYHID